MIGSAAQKKKGKKKKSKPNQVSKNSKKETKESTTTTTQPVIQEVKPPKTQSSVLKKTNTKTPNKSSTRRNIQHINLKPKNTIPIEGYQLKPYVGPSDEDLRKAEAEKFKPILSNDTVSNNDATYLSKKTIRSIRKFGNSLNTQFGFFEHYKNIYDTASWGSQLIHYHELGKRWRQNYAIYFNFFDDIPQIDFDEIEEIVANLSGSVGTILKYFQKGSRIPDMLLLEAYNLSMSRFEKWQNAMRLLEQSFDGYYAKLSSFTKLQDFDSENKEEQIEEDETEEELSFEVILADNI